MRRLAWLICLVVHIVASLFWIVLARHVYAMSPGGDFRFVSMVWLIGASLWNTEQAWICLRRPEAVAWMPSWMGKVVRR